MKKVTTRVSLQSQDMMIPPLRELMGQGDAVSKIISEVNRVAKSNFTVVVL